MTRVIPDNNSHYLMHVIMGYAYSPRDAEDPTMKDYLELITVSLTSTAVSKNQAADFLPAKAGNYMNDIERNILMSGFLKVYADVTQKIETSNQEEDVKKLAALNQIAMQIKQEPHPHIFKPYLQQLENSL